MEAKRKHIIYKEEFRRQAVEMVIHSGKTQAQVARELGCSEYSLNLWKKAYMRQQAPAEIDGEQRSPEQMFAEIRRLRKENECLTRQRENLKKAINQKALSELIRKAQAQRLVAVGDPDILAGRYFAVLVGGLQ